MSTLSGLLGGAGKPTRITTYTSGSGSFTPLSTSSSWLRVTLVGGGCGGSGAVHGSPGIGESQIGGWGGGAGASATYWIKAVEPSYSYEVGAGGAGGIAYMYSPGGPNPTQYPGPYIATAGGNTFFGSFAVSGGGSQPAGPTATTTSAGRFAYTGVIPSPGPGALDLTAASWQSGSGGMQSLPGGFSRYVPGPTPAGQGTPNIDAPGGSRPLWGSVPWTTFVSAMPNGGTYNASSPGPINYAGGGGAASAYSTGGAGGSIQSPWSGASISGATAPGYGGGGGGGGAIIQPGGYVAPNPLSTLGNGGAGSGGAIIIEEFTF